MSIKPISIETTDKKAAAGCIAITAYATLVFANDLRDPLTDRQIELEAIADLAEIVEDINLAVGNPPNHGLRENIAKLRNLLK